MAVSAEFRDHIVELLSAGGPVLSRRMFGGVGLYRESAMFGLLSGDALYFKVDARNRPDFEALGAEPFSFAMRTGRTTITSFYEVPAEVLEDADSLRVWARRAVEAALAKRESGKARIAPQGRRPRTPATDRTSGKR